MISFEDQRIDQLKELCCECDDSTGMAGRSEDSFYCPVCDKGPFCPECYHDHMVELACLEAHDLHLTESLKARISELEDICEALQDANSRLVLEKRELEADLREIRDLCKQSWRSAYRDSTKNSTIDAAAEIAGRHLPKEEPPPAGYAGHEANREYRKEKGLDKPKEDEDG